MSILLLPLTPTCMLLSLVGRHLSPSAPPFVKSLHDTADADRESKAPNMPVSHPIDLVGCTFLFEPQEDGQHFHAQIVRAIEDHEAELNKDHDCLKFLCSINDDTMEEIMSYTDILAHIQCNEESTIVWKFCHIVAHEGPLAQNHPNYKGSTYNGMIEWENGEITSEPLSIIVADDPVTCALYAKEK